MLNNVITYQTECRINYNNFLYDDLIKKYRTATLTKDEFNNNFFTNAYNSTKVNTCIMKSEIIYKELKVLTNGNEKIYLNFPILFKIETDENGFYFISEKYNMYVYGENQIETEKNLVESFMDQYNLFCLADSNTLDKNAQILKSNLKEVFNYAERKN